MRKMILPLAARYCERISILLSRLEFNSAQRCLDECVEKLTWMHDPVKASSVLLSDVLLTVGATEENYELVEQLEAMDIKYLSQVAGKTWEQLKGLGLKELEIAFIQNATEKSKHHLAMLG